MNYLQHLTRYELADFALIVLKRWTRTKDEQTRVFYTEINRELNRVSPLAQIHW